MDNNQVYNSILTDSLKQKQEEQEQEQEQQCQELSQIQHDDQKTISWHDSQEDQLKQNQEEAQLQKSNRAIKLLNSLHKLHAQRFEVISSNQKNTITDNQYVIFINDLIDENSKLQQLQELKNLMMGGNNNININNNINNINNFMQNIEMNTFLTNFVDDQSKCDVCIKLFSSLQPREAIYVFIKKCQNKLVAVKFCAQCQHEKEIHNSTLFNKSEIITIFNIFKNNTFVQTNPLNNAQFNKLVAKMIRFQQDEELQWGQNVNELLHQLDLDHKQQDDQMQTLFELFNDETLKQKVDEMTLNYKLAEMKKLDDIIEESKRLVYDDVNIMKNYLFVFSQQDKLYNARQNRTNIEIVNSILQSQRFKSLMQGSFSYPKFAQSNDKYYSLIYEQY